MKSILLDDEGESRQIKPGPRLNFIIGSVAIAFALYHIYTSAVGIPPALRHRAIHLTFTLVLAFILFPSVSGRYRPKVYLFDVFLALTSIAMGVYVYIEFENMTYRLGIPNTWDVWFGFIETILVLEATRRVVGWPMPVLAIFFVFYGLFGPYFPGPFAHRGVSFEYIFSSLYEGLEGIFGVAIGVSSTYIVLFVIFGAFLGVSGASEFFFRLAQSLVGTVRGGPAKIAVMSSSLFGTVSGSAIANVMVDGWLTIPLMKRVGFKPHVAAAVEAVASTGGQLVPPIMGAAAFIMAEYLAVPYIKIAFAACIPALLYYLSLFMMIDLEAGKRNLIGLPRAELPKFKSVMLSDGHLLIPFAALIFMLAVLFYTPIKAGFYGIIAVWMVSWVRKNTRMDLAKTLEALKKGAMSTVSVAIACACAGIIVGMFTYSGLGMKLSSILMVLSGGKLLLLLLLVGLCCIILGLGMPTTVVYIILATLAAPPLIKLGVEPIAAHLFVFYYGLLSMITPPVALAAFAAASIADTPPMKTGYTAWRLGLAGFIVPFMFVYGPPLVMVGKASSVVIATITAIVGVIALAIALQGYAFRSFPFWQRVFPFAASLLLIKAGIYTDSLGSLILLPFLFYQYRASRQETSVQFSAQRVDKSGPPLMDIE